MLLHEILLSKKTPAISKPIAMEGESPRTNSVPQNVFFAFQHSQQLLGKDLIFQNLIERGRVLLLFQRKDDTRSLWVGG